MIPAPFAFARADSADAALAALAEHGDEAKVIAGGHSLLPLMKLRLATPAVLIDINDVDGLDEIREEGDEIVIGSLVRHSAVVRSPIVRSHVPLLAATASAVGDPQVRHRGTFAGSLAHGDPAADLPAAFLALRGSVEVRSATGSRRIPADDFFLGFLETALAPDELITGVRLPKCTGAGWGFEKFTHRAQDWAIVGVAAVGGSRPGVALVNMGGRPIRATATEAAFAAGDTVADASMLADQESDPSADRNASAEYRRHLARVLTRRALADVAARDAARP